MSQVEKANVCYCMCHRTPGARHCIPCCRGKCHQCGDYIKDFTEHKKTCSDAEDPVMALLADFQRRREEPVYLFRMSHDASDTSLFGFKDGQMWLYDGESWSRMMPLKPEDYKRKEVQVFRV